MKALSLIALFFAAFLIFAGVSTRKAAGNVLSNAVITGGAIIAATVAVVWIITLIKERREK